jgi:acetolactate synthase-1/2/3 large subunit
MNGAHALLHTLVRSDVNVCFANPGTSEMHFVAAVDDVPEMRTILGLFEGVVTGAADGYARMTGRPAVTLLHLGPGMANGMANLHNARRANVPLVNIVGDHATNHKQYDALPTSMPLREHFPGGLIGPPVLRMSRNLPRQRSQRPAGRPR